MKNLSLQSYIYNNSSHEQLLVYSESFTVFDKCIGKNVRTNAQKINLTNKKNNKEKRTSFDSGTSSTLISPFQTSNTSFVF